MMAKAKTAKKAATTKAAANSKRAAKQAKSGKKSYSSKVTKLSSKPRPSTASKPKDSAPVAYRKDKDKSPEEYYGNLELDEPQVINKYLEVRTTPNKGRGIFTRVDNIPAGTLLLQETALLHARQSVTTRKAEFRRIVNTLSPDKQNKFATLTYHGLPNNEESRVVRNGFAFEEADGSAMSVVWFWVSLINHDCKPNCEFRADVPVGPNMVGYVRALVPIREAGTEISIDYIQRSEESNTAEKRAKRTSDCWGFECGCQSCANPEKSDEELAMIEHLGKSLDAQNIVKLDSAVADNRFTVDEDMGLYIALLKEWRMFDEAYTAAREASEFYSRLQDDLARAEAVRWCLEAINLGISCYGVEQFEKKSDGTILRATNGSRAPEPRYLLTEKRPRDKLMELIKETLPKLMMRKFYGNVQAQDGLDLSDVPRDLY